MTYQSDRLVAINSPLWPKAFYYDPPARKSFNNDRRTIRRRRKNRNRRGRETKSHRENRESTRDSLRRNDPSEDEGAEPVQTARRTASKTNTRRSSANLPTHPRLRGQKSLARPFVDPSWPDRPRHFEIPCLSIVRNGAKPRPEACFSNATRVSDDRRPIASVRLLTRKIEDPFRACFSNGETKRASKTQRVGFARQVSNLFSQLADRCWTFTGFFQASIRALTSDCAFFFFSFRMNCFLFDCGFSFNCSNTSNAVVACS